MRPPDSRPPEHQEAAEHDEGDEPAVDEDDEVGEE